MEPTRIDHKFTAILSAEVKEYICLMGEDEVATCVVEVQRQITVRNAELPDPRRNRPGILAGRRWMDYIKIKNSPWVFPRRVPALPSGERG